MKDKDAKKILSEIVLSLSLAGYEPYEQLTGYIKTVLNYLSHEKVMHVQKLSY